MSLTESRIKVSLRHRNPHLGTSHDSSLREDAIANVSPNPEISASDVELDLHSDDDRGKG